MCTLGPLIKQEITHDPVEGYRGWYIKDPFNKDNQEDLGLYPLNQKLNDKFSYDKESDAILFNQDDFLRSETGFYAYNYNHYNDNNYNCNDNNYNYYNYNHYNYYNYNYYNYYNYYVTGKVILSSNIVHHERGYRATKARPCLLVLLTSKDINPKFNKFIKHFNQTVKKVAKLYNIPVINYEDFK